MLHLVNTDDTKRAPARTEALREHGFGARLDERRFQCAEVIARQNPIIRDGFGSPPNALKDLVFVGKPKPDQRRQFIVQPHLPHGREMAVRGVAKSDVNTACLQTLSKVVQPDVKHSVQPIEFKEHMRHHIERALRSSVNKGIQILCAELFKLKFCAHPAAPDHRYGAPLARSISSGRCVAAHAEVRSEAHTVRLRRTVR